MNKKYYWIIGIVVAVLAGAGIFLFATSEDADASSDARQAELVSVESGILEAAVGATGKVRAEQSAALVWETSGKVKSVNINVGTDVSESEVLATLAQTSLPQSVILAQADLVSAQQSLDDLFDTDLQLAQALQSVEDAQKALDDLYNPELQQALALQAIADTEQQVDDAEYDLLSIQSTSSQADIDAQKAQVILAEEELDKARDKYEPYANKPEDNLVRANLLASLSEAQEVYDNAVANLNWMISDTPDPIDLAVIEAEFATTQAQLLEAQRDYEEIKDGPGEAEVALAEANLAAARENYADILDGPNSDDIAAAEARVAASQATLAQDAITAPFDGTITDVSALLGDLVNPNEQAFILNNLETLLIDLEISEIDINQIEVGQQVLITFDAIPVMEYEGVVIEVSMDGVETAGVVDFPVVVQITNPDDQIRLGMTASVEIIVVQQDAALLIPNQAIRVEEGVQVVYQLDKQGNMVAVPIVLGFSSNTYSEVLESSLASGDQIVLNPSVILNQTTGDESFNQLREMGGESSEGPGAGPGQFFGGE